MGGGVISETKQQKYSLFLFGFLSRRGLDDPNPHFEEFFCLLSCLEKYRQRGKVKLFELFQTESDFFVMSSLINRSYINQS